MNKILLISLVLLKCVFSAESINEDPSIDYEQNFDFENLGRIGDYGYPGNPQYDRAKGYLLKGKVKNAVSNNGNFITWDYHPAGFWGQYGYLPHVGFVAGVPGHEYSSHWSSPGDPSWQQDATITSLWNSSDAYDAWVDEIIDPENDEGNYKTIVYNTVIDYGSGNMGHNDRGLIAEQKNSLEDLDYEGGAQWVIDHNLEKIYIYLDDASLDPNLASSGIGSKGSSFISHCISINFINVNISAES